MKLSSALVFSLPALLLMSGCNDSTPKPNGTNHSSYSINVDRATDAKGYDSIQNSVYSDVGLIAIPKVGLSYFHTKDREANYQVGYGGAKSFYITETIDNNKTTHEELLKLKNHIVDFYTDTTELIIELIKRADENGSIENINSVTISKKYNNTTKNINKATINKKIEEISKLITKYGIYIQVWKNGEAGASNANLDTIIGFLENDNTNNISNIGFSIYNGLKISTLFIGNDMKKNFSNVNNNLGETHLRTVTSLVQSRDILHFEISSYAKKLKNELNVKMKKLNLKDPKAFKRSIALELYSAYSALDTIAVSSFTSKSEHKYYPQPNMSNDNNNFDDSMRAYIESKENSNTPIKEQWERDSANGWQTIKYVDTDINEIKKWFKDVEGNPNQN